MSVGDIFEEENLVNNMPNGHSYIFGQEPLLIDEHGVPYRRFEMVEHGLIELPIEDEPIAKFDLEEYKNRNGSLVEDNCYDILELGYWTKDGDYESYDSEFVEWRDSQ